VGRGAEILIVPFAAMLILAWLALLVAFFSRTLAKWLVGFAAGIFSLIVILVILENRGNIVFSLIALFGFYPMCAFTNATLALSVFALWARLRYPEVALPDGQIFRGRPRWRWFFLILIMTVAIAGYGFSVVRDWNRGEAKTIALLAGDTTLRIRRFEISGQQRKVICTDPDVLRYLEFQLRNHDAEQRFGGNSYLLLLRYEGGGTDTLSTYGPDEDRFCLYVGEPGEGGKPHGIRMSKPRPKGIDDLLSFFRRPAQDATGRVLILEPGWSHIE
jgi:hypothetical protein